MISQHIPVDLPEPTGPRMPRTKAFDRWKRSRVGLATYSIVRIALPEFHNEGDGLAPSLAAVLNALQPGQLVRDGGPRRLKPQIFRNPLVLVDRHQQGV